MWTQNGGWLSRGSSSSPPYSCFHRNAAKWEEIWFIQRQKQTFQVQNWQTGSHQGFWRGCSPGRMRILIRGGLRSRSLGSVRRPCPSTDCHCFDSTAKAWWHHLVSALGFVPPLLPFHCQHDSFKSLGALIPSTSLRACSELAQVTSCLWLRQPESWGGVGQGIFFFNLKKNFRLAKISQK